MKTSIKALIAIVLCLAVMSPTGVSAAGYEPIGGYATSAQVTWYTNPRYISNPATPGPEVAFYQTSGNPGLFLGKHNCSRGAAGPMYKQSIGSWQPVGYYSSPDTFCLFTYSNSGSGNFAGDLNWD